MHRYTWKFHFRINTNIEPALTSTQKDFQIRMRLALAVLLQDVRLNDTGTMRLIFLPIVCVVTATNQHFVINVKKNYNL